MIDWFRQVLQVAVTKTAAAVRTLREGLAKIWAWVAGHAKALGQAVVEKLRRGEVLLPRATVFAAKELPQDEPVSIGVDGEQEWLCLRVGRWTLHFALLTEGRLPRVEDVIASAAGAVLAAVPWLKLSHRRDDLIGLDAALGGLNCSQTSRGPAGSSGATTSPGITSRAIGDPARAGTSQPPLPEDGRTASPQAARCGVAKPAVAVARHPALPPARPTDLRSWDRPQRAPPHPAASRCRSRAPFSTPWSGRPRPPAPTPQRARSERVRWGRGYHPQPCRQG